jgi:hypothetical protein
MKHNAVRHLIKCAECGHLNVTSLPKELAEQRAHRARAREVAGTLKPSDAAAALAQRDHTARQLLK